MATGSSRRTCAICNKSKIAYICQGCSQYFCRDDLPKHQEILDQQFKAIQNDQDQFQRDLEEQRTDPTKHSLMEQIDQWEKDSIEKIKQTAQLCRDKWTRYHDQILEKTKTKSDGLAQRIAEINQDTQFTEIELNQLKEELVILKEEFHRPSNFALKQQSTSFINKISLFKSFSIDTQWEQSGTTVGGGNGPGDRLDQLSTPYGICIDQLNQTIYVADYKNARIMERTLDANQWRIMAGENRPGDRSNQLGEPTDVVIDQDNDCLIIADRSNKRVMRWPRRSQSSGEIFISDIDCFLAMHEDGSLYVSDYKKNEVKRWKKGETTGVVVAGGNGQGSHLNQLHSPTRLFVDNDHTLYISDRNNHRVMKWMEGAKEGVIVAGGNGSGSEMNQLSFPAGLIIDQFGQIYVADMNNHRVMRWSEKTKTETIVVGGNGQGRGANQFDHPIGLSFDSDGTLYVCDCDNHRIQKFSIQ